MPLKGYPTSAHSASLRLFPRATHFSSALAYLPSVPFAFLLAPRLSLNADRKSAISLPAPRLSLSAGRNTAISLPAPLVSPCADRKSAIFLPAPRVFPRVPLALPVLSKSLAFSTISKQGWAKTHNHVCLSHCISARSTARPGCSAWRRCSRSVKSCRTGSTSYEGSSSAGRKITRSSGLWRQMLDNMTKFVKDSGHAGV